MKRYLLDTNVISELRKGPRAARSVQAWFETIPEESVFLSVLVMGEIRRGIESVRRRDPTAASALDIWLAKIWAAHGERVLPITREIAEVWGPLNVPDPLPAIDGLLAATAIVHDLVLVTRNLKDVERAGVACLDPFDFTA